MFILLFLFTICLFYILHLSCVQLLMLLQCLWVPERLLADRALVLLHPLVYEHVCLQWVIWAQLLAANRTLNLFRFWVGGPPVFVQLLESFEIFVAGNTLKRVFQVLVCSLHVFFQCCFDNFRVNLWNYKVVVVKERIYIKVNIFKTIKL